MTPANTKTSLATRLNNPGLLEYTGTQWRGMADDQPHSRFLKFKEPKYGVRAIVRVIRTYMTKHDIKTIEGIVSRWAPPHENPTQAYIENVAKWTGLNAYTELTGSPEQMFRLAKAISRQESGFIPYDDDTYWEGVRIA